MNGIQDIQDFRPDESLRGQAIRVTAAAAKYGIAQSNLTRWAYSGLVGIIRKGPKLLELDEADVELAVRIFLTARERTGSSVRAGWILKRAMKQLTGD